MNQNMKAINMANILHVTHHDGRLYFQTADLSQRPFYVEGPQHDLYEFYRSIFMISNHFIEVPLTLKLVVD